jgi:hypothetical protein
MFGGISGFAQGLSSIPGGGLIGGQIMNAANMASLALQMQRTQFQNLPFMGGMGLAQQVATARAAALAGAPAPGATRAQIKAQIAARRAAGGFAPAGGRAELPAPESEVRAAMLGALPGMGAFALPRRVRRATPEETQKLIDANAEKARQALLKQSADQNEARRRAEQRAITETRERFYQPIQKAGRQYGAMDPTQAMQFASQLARIGGTDPTAMMDIAVAAQTRFGLGADVSGAFMRAQRRGGLVGGGPADAQMTAAIGEAMRLGLQGSEIVDFMQTTAEGIRQFENTGIPINPMSIGGIARSVSALGVGATRGMRIAQGLTGAGQRLAQTGPQGAIDIMMLQQTGFRGGGLESLMDAMIALEQGITGPQATAMMEGLVRAGGPGAGGIFTLQRGLKRLGVNVGLGEAKMIAGEIRGGKPGASENIQRIIEEQEKGAAAAPASAADIKGMAELMSTKFAPNLDRQAGLAAQQLTIGKELLSTVQTFQDTTNKMALSVTNLAGPLIEDIADGTNKIVTALQELTSAIKGEGGLGAALVKVMRPST